MPTHQAGRKPLNSNLPRRAKGPGQGARPRGTLTGRRLGPALRGCSRVRRTPPTSSVVAWRLTAITALLCSLNCRISGTSPTVDTVICGAGQPAVTRWASGGQQAGGTASGAPTHPHGSADGAGERQHAGGAAGATAHLIGGEVHTQRLAERLDRGHHGRQIVHRLAHAHVHQVAAERQGKGAGRTQGLGGRVPRQQTAACQRSGRLPPFVRGLRHAEQRSRCGRWCGLPSLMVTLT